MDYLDSIKDDYNELSGIKTIIESEPFQKYIAKPMEKQRESLKYAYQCESLKELHAMKGKKQGIDAFFSILKDIDNRYKAAIRDLQQFGK